MSHDPHPWLKHLEDRLGPDVDQAALRVFTTYAPHERQDIIERTERAISDEDTPASLRQKSQLMDFNRKLKTANGLLKRVGR